MSTITRLFIILNVLVFVLFGLAFIVAPTYFASTVDVQLPTTTALADLRAIYGGLSLSVGIFFALGLVWPGWVLPSLWLIAASSLALGSSRIYSIIVSGMPDSKIFLFMTMELLAFAIGVWLYRKESQNRVAVAR